MINLLSAKPLLFPIQKNIVFFIFMYLLGAICIIIDPTVNKTVTFFELFLDLYIVCFALSLFPRKVRTVFKIILSFIFYFFAIVEVYLIVRLGSPITPTFVQMVLETDRSEATEALASYITLKNVLSPVLFVVGLMVIHIQYSLKQLKLKENNLPCLFTILLTTLLVLSFVVSFRPKKFMAMMYMGNHETFLNLQGMGYYKPEIIYYLPIYKLLYSLKENSFGVEEIEELKETIKKSNITSCTFESPNIIVVIGESHNKHHSQLYGYNKPTTPFQLKEMEKGNLVVFSDVITSFNATTESFKNMFSLYSYDDKGSWSQYPLFPVLFRKAGYHTAFITNQFTQDLNANFSDFDAGMFFNNKEISNAQFDVRNICRHEYDEDLLSDYDSLKQYNAKNNLLVFHLRGLHVKYHLRYPSKWNKFKTKSYDRSDLTNADLEVLAAYDNATLYNDFILKEIINRFDQEDAVVIYIPDHGEVVFDGCQTFGRPMVFDANNLFQQFQIPFWIYMSEKYQAQHPQMVEKMHKAKDKPFMTDNISQLLIGLAGIETEYYSPLSDPLSDDYNTHRKRMIRGEYDYDDIMKGYHLTVSN
jgi:heptose-I-phosphate ethanolaminephosphotransferase